jgi:hypothetical protein
MLEFSMAAFLRNLDPPGVPQQSQDVAKFHGGQVPEFRG